MQQAQPCTKCKKLPEDILMLACSHDLCLDCAAERLNFEMKKKKPANSIVCQLCYERTPLDTESVAELEKLIPNLSSKPTVAKSYVENNRSYDSTNRNEKFQRVAQRVSQEERPKEKSYDRQPIRDYTYNPNNAPGSNSLIVSGVSSKKNCNEHPQEEILYFCFDCKCECICPECIIHGKHKEHDVKTIRKAHPLVKAELQASLDKIESSIENLLIKKSQVEKNIRALNQQNSLSKRQIQTAFEEVRNKLAQQEKDILARCDANLNQSIQELEKSIKIVIKRIDELKTYSSATGEYMKKQELVTLNFYARKWKEINDETKESHVNLPYVAPTNNEKILSAILEVTDHVEKINSTVYSEKRRT